MGVKKIKKTAAMTSAFQAEEPKVPRKKGRKATITVAPPDNPEMRRLNGKLLKPGKKRIKEKSRAPLRMKKIVVKVPKQPMAEQEFANTQQDFAFAFAEAMKRRAQEVDRNAQSAHAIRMPKRPVTRKSGETVLQFSRADLAQFRRQLLTLRDSVAGKTRILKRNALEQVIDRAGEDEDGSDSFMRLQNLGQADEQNRVLQKIDDALRRIGDGTYGICEVCGQLIRKPRLMHLPFAHTCMECQSAMEAR